MSDETLALNKQMAAIALLSREDDSRPSLAGVRIDDEGEWAIASDGFRLAVTRLAIAAPAEFRGRNLGRARMWSLRSRFRYAERAGSSVINATSYRDWWALAQVPGAAHSTDLVPVPLTGPWNFPGDWKALAVPKASAPVATTVHLNARFLREVCDVVLAAGGIEITLGLSPGVGKGVPGDLEEGVPGSSYTFEPVFWGSRTAGVRGAIMPMWMSKVDWTDIGAFVAVDD